MTMSPEHKRKISAGVKRYHAKCNKCAGGGPKSTPKPKKPKSAPKPKSTPKPKVAAPPAGDLGRRLGLATAKIERRAKMMRDKALARRIRGY